MANIAQLKKIATGKSVPRVTAALTNISASEFFIMVIPFLQPAPSKKRGHVTEIGNHTIER
ncbi:MAG: hypothetical protein GQ559_06520 [Desulfobulbaceae bacterium]|nr:hypothetical protein [Desulfobulbaceae bacterium]